MPYGSSLHLNECESWLRKQPIVVQQDTWPLTRQVVLVLPHSSKSLESKPVFKRYRVCLTVAQLPLGSFPHGREFGPCLLSAPLPRAHRFNSSETTNPKSFHPQTTPIITLHARRSIGMIRASGHMLCNTTCISFQSDRRCSRCNSDDNLPLTGPFNFPNPAVRKHINDMCVTSIPARRDAETKPLDGWQFRKEDIE